MIFPADASLICVRCFLDPVERVPPLTAGNNVVRGDDHSVHFSICRNVREVWHGQKVIVPDDVNVYMRFPPLVE